MVCRNKDKAEEARADIVKETGNKVESDSPLQSVFLKNSGDAVRRYPDLFYCRRFMSISWTCLRPRRSGSLPRASRKSSRPSMCWWAVLWNCQCLNFTAVLLLCWSFLPIQYCYWKYFPLRSVQINNAGSIMSQREVNAEGLEKSFATNVLGESRESAEVWKGPLMTIKGGDCHKDGFLSSARHLYSDQEPHSPAGEERWSQSGESFVLVCLLIWIILKPAGLPDGRWTHRWSV